MDWFTRPQILDTIIIDCLLSLVIVTQGLFEWYSMLTWLRCRLPAARPMETSLQQRPRVTSLHMRGGVRLQGHGGRQDGIEANEGVGLVGATTRCIEHHGGEELILLNAFTAAGFG